MGVGVCGEGEWLEFSGQPGEGERVPWVKRKGKRIWSSVGRIWAWPLLLRLLPSYGAFAFLITGKFLGSAYISPRYPLPVFKSRFVPTLLGYGRAWFEWVDLWCKVPYLKHH